MGGKDEDVIDWRPRGVYGTLSGTSYVGRTCSTSAIPVTTKKDGTTDPCSWFEMTGRDNDVAGDASSRADNQHHQGIDWVYGGWDRDVMQGDQSANGPNPGDRLIDWSGVYNLYSHCNAAYGGFNDIRIPSPSMETFVQEWATGLGAGRPAATSPCPAPRRTTSWRWSPTPTARATARGVPTRARPATSTTRGRAPGSDARFVRTTGRTVDGMPPSTGARFVLHDHRRPSPHFDLRLEEDGVLRSWAVPKGLPDDTAHDRLAIAVDDHELDHVDFEDEHKSIADDGHVGGARPQRAAAGVLAARTCRRTPLCPDPHGWDAVVAAPHPGAAASLIRPARSPARPPGPGRRRCRSRRRPSGARRRASRRRGCRGRGRPRLRAGGRARSRRRGC